jgi:MiaB-like tRNA modifying enzyme
LDLKSLKFYLETYGCSLNTADSDIIVGRLNPLGAERVQTMEDAGVIILNTCGVKEPTEDRIIHRLQELSDEGKPLLITGCLPKISLERIKQAIPTFGAILGPQSIESIAPILDRVMKGQRGILHLEPDTSSKLQFFEGPPDSVICTIPICEGCLGSCSYCAVRFARANLKSYTVDEILRVARRSIHLGYLEIRMTAQDAGAFGHDSGETLAKLLYALGEIPGKHKFRLGMFNPNLVIDSLDDILDSMSSDRFFKFFHVPLQSGDDGVLQDMSRSYSVHEWKGIISKIRGRFPRATIATDIIVGFPNESDAAFDETMRLIEEIRPSVVNVSKYGDRPGTIASESRNKVETSVKKARSRRLSKLVAELAIESNRSWIGWSGPVIVTGLGSKGGYMGRTYSYKPVIIHDSVRVGDIANIKIVSAERTHLLGEPVTS